MPSGCGWSEALPEPPPHSRWTTLDWLPGSVCVLGVVLGTVCGVTGLRLEADLALGRAAEVVPELEALVREHPLREGLRELLILALYRAGRQADALAAYQDARARWWRARSRSG